MIEGAEGQNEKHRIAPYAQQEGIGPADHLRIGQLREVARRADSLEGRYPQRPEPSSTERENQKGDERCNIDDKGADFDRSVSDLDLLTRNDSETGADRIYRSANSFRRAAAQQPVAATDKQQRIEESHFAHDLTGTCDRSPVKPILVSLSERPPTPRSSLALEDDPCLIMPAAFLQMPTDEVRRLL